MTIHEKIKFIREKNKLSQTELGNALGVAQKLISNWESGRNDPSFQNIKQIIEKFDISPAWLLKEEYEVDMQHDIDEMYFKAKSLAVDPSQKNELKDYFNHFISINSTLADTLAKLKTIKGKELFSKLAEAWHGKGERMLVVLYEFLNHLKNQNIALQSTMKADFVKALDNFRPSKHFFINSETDKANLIKWVEENMTDVEIFDILSSADNMKEVIDTIKDQLNLINRVSV